MSYLQTGFIVKHLNSNIEFFAVEEVPSREIRMSYKQQVLFIKSTGISSRRGYGWMTDNYEMIENAYEMLRHDPELEEAIMSPHIGYDGIESLNYRKQLVERELIKTRKTTHARRIADLLEHNGIIAGFYSNADIKERLENIHDELKIRGNPVASDITTYFHARETMSNKDGKRIHGYSITRKKDL